MEKPLIDYLLEEVLEIKDLTDVDKFEAEITKGNLSEISFYKIEEFVKFILYKKIDSIFFNFIFNEGEKSDYLITDMYLDELNPSYLEIIKEDVDEHNSYIESIDLDEPTEVTLFFSLDSILYTYSLQLKEEGFLESGYEALKSILKDNQDKLSLIIESDNIKKKELKEKLKKELKNEIVSDEKFRLCSNKSLRASYINDLIESKDFKEKYRIAFEDKDGYFRQYAIYDFIEFTWKEIKNGYI